MSNKPSLTNEEALEHLHFLYPYGLNGCHYCAECGSYDVVIYANTLIQTPLNSGQLDKKGLDARIKCYCCKTEQDDHSDTIREAIDLWDKAQEEKLRQKRKERESE